MVQQASGARTATSGLALALAQDDREMRMFDYDGSKSSFDSGSVGDQSDQDIAASLSGYWAT